jgi:hypothetical protein
MAWLSRIFLFAQAWIAPLVVAASAQLPPAATTATTATLSTFPLQ